MHSDDMSDVPQALQSAVREEMKLEPKDFDFDDSCFSVHFEYRLTAVIAELPDCPHDYELVSTWIGRVQDSRVLDGKGEQKTVPAFIREYIHLDGKAAGGEGVQSKDGDEHEALPGRQSTAMAELVAYNEAFQDGYFLAPNRLSSYGWPTLSVRQFLAHSRKYHLLALYERQDNDRLLTSPPAHAQDAAEFQEVERDLKQRELNTRGPFFERLIFGEPAANSPSADRASGPPASYLSLALFDAKVPIVVRSPPSTFVARDQKQSKRWFKTVLSIELSCLREDKTSRILEWVAPLEQQASDDAERKHRLNKFKEEVRQRLNPMHRIEDQMREMMVCWDRLVKHKSDPVHNWSAKQGGVS